MQGDSIAVIQTGLFLHHITIFFTSYPPSFKTVLTSFKHVHSAAHDELPAELPGCCSSADLCSDNNRHLCTPLMDGGRLGRARGRRRKYYHNNTQSIFMLIQCNKPPKIILRTFNFLCTRLLRIFF